MNKYLLSLLSILTTFLFLTGCGHTEPEFWSSGDLQEEITYEKDFSDVSEDELVKEVSSDSTVFVHVSGEVACPGLYELCEGSRLYDAVQAAGGFTKEADSDYANLAEIVSDGCKYTIYSVSEVSEMALKEQDNSPYTEDGQLDINSADASSFMELSGIGQTRAQAIVAYRDEHGLFQKIEDIMEVSGIGQSTFDNIKDSITVR